jgi:hypothetical protein
MNERILSRRIAKLIPADTQRTRRDEPLSAIELAQIRTTVEHLSYWMDSRFQVPVLGWRFGFDAIIGLIPGLGDAATTIVSLYLLTLASQCGVPKITLTRMGLNVAIDFILGSLPLVGDVFDVWWKANQMNAVLLRERLAHPDFRFRRGTASDWFFVGAMLVVLLALFVGMVALVRLGASYLWNALTGLSFSAT